MPGATPPVRRMQRIALTLLVVSGAINTMDRATLAIANPLVRHDMGLDPAQMGLLLSAFLWAYAFAQLPVGALADRLGPHRLLGLGMFFWSLAQAACGFVGSMAQFVAARVVLGIGEAPQFPAGARVVRDWFPLARRGMASGIFTCSSTLGTALAAPLLTALMLSVGWRWMFAATGAAGIAAAVVWFLLYRDPEEARLTPEDDRSRTEGETRRAAGRITAAQWRMLFRSPVMWGLIFGYFGVIYVNWLFNTWLPGYLEIERHMSVRQTGWAASIPYSFAVAGSLTAGWVIDRLARAGLGAVNSRRAPLCAVLVLEAGFVLAAALVPSNAVAVACLSGALFCGNAASTFVWGMVSIIGPAACTSSIGSLQNFGGYLGGALAPVVTGFIVRETGSFIPALLVGAALPLVSALIYLLFVRGPVEVPEAAWTAGSRGAAA